MSRAPSSPPPAGGHWALHLGLLAIAVAFPLVFPSPFMVNFGVLALFYAFIGQSWNIAGGFAGQLSFGHVVFFGAGAYASTIFQLRFGFSPWVGLPASAVAGAVVGLVISAKYEPLSPARNDRKPITSPTTAPATALAGRPSQGEKPKRS